MEKITFKINGVEVEGVILHSYPGSNKKDLTVTHHIVYAQNRLVKLRVLHYANVSEPEIHAFILVEYCTIPELDEISPKETKAEAVEIVPRKKFKELKKYEKIAKETIQDTINSVNSALHYYSNMECVLVSKDRFEKLQKSEAILKDLEGSIKNLVKSFNL